MGTKGWRWAAEPVEDPDEEEIYIELFDEDNSENENGQDEEEPHSDSFLGSSKSGAHLGTLKQER